MGGYTGKILKIDLTTGSVSLIPTSRYEQWVGGHGMGSAIFFDLVKDKTISAFDPANVITLMTSPISGTIVPSGAGRTEVQGIGPQAYPKEWFTRSNFGGRFSSQLKYAGWDGIVLVGAAAAPVWIDIRDERVEIRSCSDLGLWGTDTRKCQEIIWDFVADGDEYGDWKKPNADLCGQTTQRPAVVAIGPAGENLSRLGCLMHDAGNSSGQGGFGAVWGAKKLKAISVIGTGYVPLGDPKKLMETRLWHHDNYGFNYDDPLSRKGIRDLNANGMTDPPKPAAYWGKLGAGEGRPREGQRPQACVGCYAGCRGRYKSGIGNEAKCLATEFYSEAHTHMIQRKATDLVNCYGLNALEMTKGLLYLKKLHSLGVLGKGKEIDCPLDFASLGTLKFVEQLIKAVSYRNDGLGSDHPFGDAIAEGFMRAAASWGRLEEDSMFDDRLQFPYWGYPEHGYDCRAELEWGYGSILGDRDINEHEFNTIMWNATLSLMLDSLGIRINTLDGPAEEVVGIYTAKMEPYDGAAEDRMKMLDYSSENMYSVHIARLVSWHRHYTRFWKQTMLLCDFRWPDFLNHYSPDKAGSACMAEPKFLSAVLGREITFLEGMELGRKIWNLDNAIWTLQGRHRSMVRFAPYIYRQGFLRSERTPSFYLPVLTDGAWSYQNMIPLGRKLDEQGFEDFKTLFYEQEGWDSATGWPLRSTLEALSLGYVADELAARGRLG